MKFSVLGAGRWGSFIAWYLDKIGNDVTLWGRPDGTKISQLLRTRQNDYVTLPDSITLSTDLESSIKNSDYIIISISSQGLRNLAKEIIQIDGYENKKFVLCMKGVEKSTGARLSTILIDSGVPKDNIAAWVGPGHIQEFTRMVPNCMIRIHFFLR